MLYLKKYVILGVIFGSLFPLIATPIEAWLRYGELSFSVLMLAQIQQPLLLIIDTAPLFLGLFAGLAGYHYDKLRHIDADRQSLVTQLQNKNDELEEKVKERTQLLQLNMQKAQAANQAKSQFVAALSHELRTPITSIAGSIKLLLGGVTQDSLSDKATELLSIANNNCQRLSHMVEDLLDSASLESGSMKVTCHVQPLAPLLKQVVKDALPICEIRQIDMHLFLPNYPIEVNVDKFRLQQVVTNVLNNAIQYSPDGSDIEISAYVLDNAVRIQVSDKGPGIDKQMQSLIFQQFTQSNQGNTRQVGGIGLGLNIAQGLLQKMQGHIEFESVKNQGTDFYIILPPVSYQKQVINRF